jgi:hypothetical protein
MTLPLLRLLRRFQHPLPRPAGRHDHLRAGGPARRGAGAKRRHILEQSQPVIFLRRHALVVMGVTHQRPHRVHRCLALKINKPLHGPRVEQNRAANGSGNRW